MYQLVTKFQNDIQHPQSMYLRNLDDTSDKSCPTEW